MPVADYWACVLPPGGAAPPLQPLLRESKAVGKVRRKEWKIPGASGGAAVTLLATQAGDIRAMLHVAKPDGPTRPYLHSAYPYIAGGAALPLILKEVAADSFGLEAVLGADAADGRSFDFFDPLYCLNQHRYQPGKEYRFFLGAFSSGIEAVEAGTVYMDDPGNPGRKLEIEIAECRLLLPVGGADREHYDFQGPVRGVRTVEFHGRRLTAARVEIFEYNDGNGFELEVYAPEERVDAALRPGGVAAGSMWLHGHLGEAG